MAMGCAWVNKVSWSPTKDTLATPFMRGRNASIVILSGLLLDPKTNAHTQAAVKRCMLDVELTGTLPDFPAVAVR